MKILILNGSPRGETSNTLQLTRAFVEGLGEKEAHDVETIEIKRMDIQPCLGCFACWTKTPGQCVLRDDMADLLTRYRGADLVIWSFPLYYFGMPSGIKAFMDRLLPNNLPYIDATDDGRGGHPSRYDLRAQKHVLISTCGFYAVTNNYDAVLKQFEIAFGGQAPAILCPEGELFRVPQLASYTQPYLERVRAAGVEYASDGALSHETQEELRRPLFAAEQFIEMANANWDMELAKHGAQAPGSSQAQEQDVSHAFMRQMCATFRRETAGNAKLVLEMYFNDLDKTYQMHIANGSCELKLDAAAPYTTRIETPFSVWLEISKGNLDPVKAMMEHKYKVLGDFGTMLRFGDFFASPARQQFPRQAKAPGEKKSNMMVLILPWIAIWELMSIHANLGASFGILASLFVLANRHFRRTPYETASAFAITGLCLLHFLGLASVQALAALASIAWGSMWMVSVFRPIPLCAYYSCNSYGGEAAFGNALFIRTNRIIAAAWGIFILAMALPTFALAQMGNAPMFAIANYLIQLPLGLFTIWFSKWYPARVARA